MQQFHFWSSVFTRIEYIEYRNVDKTEWGSQECDSVTFETEVFLIARFINICKIVLLVSQSTFPEQLGTMLTGFEGDLAMIVSTYYKLLTYFCRHYCRHK